MNPYGLSNLPANDPSLRALKTQATPNFGGAVAQSGHGGLDWIPTLTGTLGGIGLGALGTAIAPGIGTAAGGIAGFGGGQALGQGIEDMLTGHHTTGRELLNSGIGGAATGAIGGLVGKGVGALGGKLISKSPAAQNILNSIMQSQPARALLSPVDLKAGLSSGLGQLGRLGQAGKLNVAAKLGGKMNGSPTTEEIASFNSPQDFIKSRPDLTKFMGPQGMSNLYSEAIKTGGRSGSQFAIETAAKAGNYNEVGRLIKALPDSDPYKQTMIQTFANKVPGLRGIAQPTVPEDVNTNMAAKIFAQQNGLPAPQAAPLASSDASKGAMNLFASLNGKEPGALTTSLAGKAASKQAMLLQSQYGTIPKNIADQTKPGETFVNLSKIGLEKPEEVEAVSKGAIPVINSAVAKAASMAGQVPIEGTSSLPPIRQIIGDSIKSSGVVGNEAKSMTNVLEGQLNILAGGEGGSLKPGANPSDTMQVIRFLDGKASALYNQANRTLADPSKLEAQAKAYSLVSQELQDRLYGIAGASSNVAKVLTPQLRQQLIELAPNNAKWVANVDNNIMKQTTMEGLRSSMKDLVRGNRVIEASAKNAMTFGGRNTQPDIREMTATGMLANGVNKLINSNVLKRAEARGLGALAQSPAAGKAATIKDVMGRLGKGVVSVPQGLSGLGYQAGSLAARAPQGAPGTPPQANAAAQPSMADQYAADPTNPQFLGVDPAQFGYPADNTSGFTSQLTPQLIEQLALADISSTGGKNMAAISALGSLSKITNPQTVTKPSAADMSTASGIQDAFSYLDSAEQELTQSGGAKGPILGGLSTLPVTGQYTNPSGVAYNQTKIEIASALARALTGSSRPAASIIEHYMKSLPGVDDRSAVAQAKLNNIRLELTNKAQNYANASPALAQLLGQSQDPNSLADLAQNQPTGLSGLMAQQ